MSFDLAVIHEELLILLQRLHEICLENDIRYSLHGGTLLGAVREKGFIPWDDDADITLTRGEFEKLRKVLRNMDLGKEFRFDEDSRYPKFVMKREGKPPVWTDIFIYPGYKFKAMQGLITNYHLPESTLVMLVSASAGRENVLNAYNIAVGERYRFFSFGDAMFIG